MIRKEILEGECIPKGYGLAYRQFHRASSILYPIPLNLIVRWWWDFYWKLAKGWFPIKYEEEMRKKCRSCIRR